MKVGTTRKGKEGNNLLIRGLKAENLRGKEKVQKN